MEFNHCSHFRPGINRTQSKVPRGQTWDLNPTRFNIRALSQQATPMVAGVG